jgi:anti-sigma B factor antagonist
VASRSFSVDVQRGSGRLVVVPTGELDIATVGQVRAALADRAPGEGVVLDLRSLDFLDTSGLQLIVEMHREAREQDYPLTILRGSPGVQRVFEIAGLDAVLPFSD